MERGNPVNFIPHDNSNLKLFKKREGTKPGKTDRSETGSAKLNYIVNLGQQWKPTHDCSSLLMVFPLLQYYIRPLTGKKASSFIHRRDDNWCSCISFETDKFRNSCPLVSAGIWHHIKTSQALWGFSHELPYDTLWQKQRMILQKWG